MLQVLYWVLGLMALMYLGAPVLIRLTTMLTASPDYRPLNTTDAPREVWEYLLSSARELEPLGFYPTAYLEVRAVQNVRTYLLMLLHPQHQDLANVIVMYIPTAGNDGMSASGWKVSTRYMEFCTEYEDGFSVDTYNTSTIPSFKRMDTEVKARVPSVKDPGELYRLHQFLLARCGRAGRKVTYAPTEVLAHRLRVERKGFDQQVKFGRMYLDPLVNAYRPTWIGAYLMAWGLLWPVTSFRRMRLRQEERRLLAEFRAANPTSQPA